MDGGNLAVRLAVDFAVFAQCELVALDISDNLAFDFNRSGRDNIAGDCRILADD